MKFRNNFLRPITNISELFYFHSLTKSNQGNISLSSKETNRLMRTLLIGFSEIL